MRTTPRPTSLTVIAITAVVLMACTPATSFTDSATASASQSTAATPSASEEACTTEGLPTKAPGTLTIGTDNPAFPPYFAEPEDGEDVPEPWGDGVGNPYNGRGFESAIAYALADELGFTQDQVDWIPVTFNNSIAPGPKDFDVYLAQVSFTEERTEAVDLSEGYFFSNQALITTADSPLANATSLADIADAKLGAAGNTTSLTYITDKIQPTQEPRVYDDNTGAKLGLEAGQVKGVVFDAATAYYIVNVEMDDGVLVGQLPSDPGEQEHFSFVLDKDSPLTDCVDQALLTMGENGQLDSIAAEWLSDIVDLPFLSE